MPTKDFKKEPTLDRLKRIWNENHGNWLLATCVVVSILGWSIGYFDLIPEVTAVKRPSNPSLLATGRSLIVTVVGCQSDEGQVVTMLYNADQFGPESVPIRADMLPVEDQQSVWSIHNLQFGAYVVFAFHDVNSDDELTPATERQGFSRRSDASDPLVAGHQLSDLSEAAFLFNKNKDEIVVQLNH